MTNKVESIARATADVAQALFACYARGICVGFSGLAVAGALYVLNNTSSVVCEGTDTASKIANIYKYSSGKQACQMDEDRLRAFASDYRTPRIANVEVNSADNKHRFIVQVVFPKGEPAVALYEEGSKGSRSIEPAGTAILLGSHLKPSDVYAIAQVEKEIRHQESQRPASGPVAVLKAVFRL